MSVTCKTPEELSKAIKEKEKFIVIEGDLKNKVFRIKAVGKVVWGVCAVALGVATAITIGVTAGGIGVLNTLRDRYKIIDKDDEHIKLQRK